MQPNCMEISQLHSILCIKLCCYGNMQQVVYVKKQLLVFGGLYGPEPPPQQITERTCS